MDNRKRTGLQAAAALLQNAYLKGFLAGKIYTGPLKTVCVPGLNCYSCPGALGSCPIGSLQNALTAGKLTIPYYVLGLIFFFGALLGRLVCGFLCPFGFLQDLLAKVPFPKKLHTFPADRPLRKVKYLVLALLVLGLPSVVRLTPFFCKYLCPSGTLSGILLALGDHRLFALLGSRFAFKTSILALVLLTSVVLARPFCRYLCPLGAIYGCFNKVSAVRLSLDQDRCTGCQSCSRVCPMACRPDLDPNSAECIRCGKCVDACPEHALSYTHLLKGEHSHAE